MLKSNVVVFVIALGIFALAQFALLHTYLYWRYPNVDIPMHFLGGVIIALGIFAARDLHLPVFGSLTTTPRALGFLFCIAVVWEWLEYLYGHSVVGKSGFVFDTVTDLILGVAGGFLGLYVARNLEKLDHDNT
ncbi:MAG: hypothetical protein WDZ93_02620 [Candidatus Paceibacterota bacterium]